MVTHQLQVERRTGKVRRPETDVLPLCHATNSSTHITNVNVVYLSFIRTIGFSLEQKYLISKQCRLKANSRCRGRSLCCFGRKAINWKYASLSRRDGVSGVHGKVSNRQTADIDVIIIQQTTRRFSLSSTVMICAWRSLLLVSIVIGKSLLLVPC